MPKKFACDRKASVEVDRRRQLGHFSPLGFALAAQMLVKRLKNYSRFIELTCHDASRTRTIYPLGVDGFAAKFGGGKLTAIQKYRPSLYI